MKKQIRKEILAKRKALSNVEFLEKSTGVLENIIISDLASSSQNIMAFMDFRNEVATKPVIEYLWALEKAVYIPLVDNSTMTITIHRITDFSDMTLSSFGILEPNPEKTPAVDPNVIDLIFAPGVAFDKSGYRIGYGAGMYDKMLAVMDKKPVVAALSFDLQIVDKVPHESHDVKMDYIITETEIIKCQRY